MSHDFDYWLFQCDLARAVDGDTIDLLVDLGFKTSRIVRVRFAGVDTAEIYGPNSEEEYERGKEHAGFVADWLQVARVEHPGEWPLIVETEKQTGKFGRYIATSIHRKYDGEELLTDIIAAYPEVAEP